MLYFTKAIIRSYSNRRFSQKSYQDYLKGNIPAPGRIRVFLSHSHIDVQDMTEEDINALITILIDYSYNVYIDWLDPEMPSQPCEETAKRLQQKIDACDRFLLVATSNAINSRWVPWELGYADKAKGINNISVIPIADPNGRWQGAEYLRLYPQLIISADDKPAIFAPSNSSGYGLWHWVEKGELYTA